MSTTSVRAGEVFIEIFTDIDGLNEGIKNDSAEISDFSDKIDTSKFSYKFDVEVDKSKMNMALGKVRDFVRVKNYRPLVFLRLRPFHHL